MVAIVVRCQPLTEWYCLVNEDFTMNKTQIICGSLLLLSVSTCNQMTEFEIDGHGCQAK